MKFLTRSTFRRAAVIAGFAACASAAPAISTTDIKNQIEPILARSAVSGNTWGIQMQNLSGTVTEYALNPTTQRRPASNTKIFTSSAAFGLLGTGYVFQGQTIQSYCTTMNLNSDNVMADDLIVEIGRVIGGSATYSAGTAATLNWCNSVGVDMTGALMYDGSGLDYNNRFSASQTLKLLRYMNNNYPTYDDTLPVGCQSGTLGSRFCGTVGSGNVVAKTGTLPNGLTVSLSGFMNNPNDGKKYLFSIYANNAVDVDSTRQAMDDMVNVLGQQGMPNDGSPDSGIVMDNGTSANVEQGAWTSSANPGFYGTNSRYASTGTGSVQSVFTPNLTTAGNYEVFAWWVAGSNRITNAQYQVVNAGGTNNVTVDQTNATLGSKWNSLGTYAFNTGTAGKAALTNLGAAGKVVSADAISFVYRGPSAVIVDNTSAGFSASTNWFASTSTPGYYGTNYHARATASISDPATWTASLPSAGSYKVFARWTDGSNRATVAPYQIVHTGGTATVNVNQQANTATWVLLGTYNFNAGSNVVRLSCWTTAGFYVIADAVKFEKQ